MKTAWLTYAWTDNADDDVTFLAQELGRAGLNIKLDRWNLSAGQRLWPQIESFILDSSKSDAWLFYATQASLNSPACQEELAYALNRALDRRGSGFPMVALFPASIDGALIPASIRTRLYVELTDPFWRERVVAAVERRPPTIQESLLTPYVVKVHTAQKEGDRPFAIEMRPRAGTWSPPIVCVPMDEKDALNPLFCYGPANRYHRPISIGSAVGDSGEGRYWCARLDTEATPTWSCYVLSDAIPSMVIFGVEGGKPQYRHSFSGPPPAPATLLTS